jgi:hypothetical protein
VISALSSRVSYGSFVKRYDTTLRYIDPVEPPETTERILVNGIEVDFLFSLGKVS